MSTSTSAPHPAAARANGTPWRGRRAKPAPKPDTPAALGAPPKLRRRPGLIALGTALVALGGVGAAWLTTTAGNTQAVLAVRAGVERGAVIDAGDLVVARINPDPALATVAEAQHARVLGKRAAHDLPAGALLTPASVTTAVIPARGASLVGVSVTPAQLPARPLRPGDTVRIVDTPRAQDNPPRATPASATATVVEAHAPGDDGRAVIDVTVPSGGALRLAARAATGRIALVLDSGVR